MYGKLFASMYEGTLYGNWQALVTFQQMIVLCDRDGVVDMTPQAIAARTSIPLKIIQAGIALLEQPDPYSRTPDNEGRRIELLDTHRPWGWRITNYVKYRNLVDAETVREQNRERQRKKRERDSHAPSQAVTAGNDESRHAEAEAEVEPSPSLRSGEGAPRKRPSRRPPAGFAPDLAFARAELPDIDAEAEAAKFCDFEFAKPRSDWPATWRNWVRGAKESGRYVRSATPPVIAGPTSDGKPPRWQ
jgi:hypothetical protein